MPILTAKSAKRLHGVSSERSPVGAAARSPMEQAERSPMGAAKRSPARAAKRSPVRAAKRLHMKAVIALYIILSIFTGFTGFTGFIGFIGTTGFTSFTGFTGFAWFTGACAYARDLSGPEYRVKAAFIYNFTKFVEWPQTAFENNSDFIILSVAPNNDPDSDVFFSLNNKTVGGKKIKVRICDDIKDIGDCHILFLDSTDPKYIQDVLRTVRDKNVLTVGHIRGFIQEGGIINFFIKDGKLRFEVNLDAAKHSGIRLGSQILMSAESITEEHK
jgi:hypothetical protein